MDLYCICKQPYNPADFMIECEGCSDWFHGSCVNVTPEEGDRIDVYFCPSCQATKGPVLYKSTRERTVINYAMMEDNALEMTAAEPAIDHVARLRKRSFPDALDSIVQRLPAAEVTLETLERSGFKAPILVDDSENLGMSLPDASFTVDDVAEQVGGDFPVNVIDVATQVTLQNTWQLNDWRNYFNTPSAKRSAVLNVISLEFSRSPLASVVEAPAVVRAMDWIDTAWPRVPRGEQKEARKETDEAERQEEEQEEDTTEGEGAAAQGKGVVRDDAPQIQKYCLMGVEGSWTDFHIDFGGSSVWYHVFRGEKVFYFVEPTEKNIKAFAQWSKSPDQSKTFFGDLASCCYSCRITQGQTMLIPSGWIHGVHTPKDSLVFGGNFIHSLAIASQFKIYELEAALGIADRFRLPSFESLVWYAAQMLSQEKNSDMLPDAVLRDIKTLLKTLRQWAEAPAHKQQIPTDVDVFTIIDDLSKLSAKHSLPTLVLKKPEPVPTLKLKLGKEEVMEVMKAPVLKLKLDVPKAPEAGEVQAAPKPLANESLSLRVKIDPAEIAALAKVEEQEEDEDYVMGEEEEEDVVDDMHAPAAGASRKRKGKDEDDFWAPGKTSKPKVTKPAGPATASQRRPPAPSLPKASSPSPATAAVAGPAQGAARASSGAASPRAAAASGPSPAHSPLGSSVSGAAAAAVLAGKAGSSKKKPLTAKERLYKKLKGKHGLF